MKISDKLKLIKQVSGLTQDKIAREIGVSFATVNSWINEKSNPHKKKQDIIDELYAKFSGSKIISEDVLVAKKEILKKKQEKRKDVLGFILKNKDVLDRFVLSLTYNSNKIEGSTLTENETANILFHKMSLANKSLVEQIEAKNHQTAFNFMLEWLKNKKQINEELILKLHSILMNSILSNAGSYRYHSVRIVGSNVVTANYLKIKKLMSELVIDLNKKGDIFSRVAEIHSRLEQIHPFSDGNGRVGRLLIHAMLLKNNFPPAIILESQKNLYMKYLNKSQIEGDLSLLDDFLCDAVLTGFDFLDRK